MAPKCARDILRVDPKDPTDYGDFSLAHLTCYSVHWLNAWDIQATYENISVLNARLFPRDFSLSGFPELPDAMRTNRSLLQMRPKYRGFATSDPRRGVYLTEKGRAEVARMVDRIGSPTFEGKPVSLDPATLHPRRPSNDRERTYNPAQVVEERKTRLLFRRYQEGRLEETDVVHLLGLLGLYDHTPPAEIRKEFRLLREAAEKVGEAHFLEFLDAVHERFLAYFNRQDNS